jgi:ribosome-binding factor A
MPSKIRMRRIADRVREVLSEMLVKEVADPRLLGIQITDVRIDRELVVADVFVSAVEGEERSGEILKGLRHAAGFFRSELAARIDLRAFPKLRFHWDPTPERADHIERLLASIRSEPGTTPAVPDGEDKDETDES